MSLLFIRSPDSGQVYTFMTNTATQEVTPAVLSDMIVSSARNAQTICIDTGELPIVDAATSYDDMSIFIEQFAAGPSAVEVRSNDFFASLPTTSSERSTRC
jgi:hypothetical protein